MTTFRQWGKLAQVILLILGLVVLYFLVQWLATSLKDPNQMGIVESMVMDMEIQVPEGAAPVALETVTPGPFIHAVTYTGTVDAYNDVPVFPRIEGWITQLPVYAGDRVKKGQLLAQLDTSEQASRYQEARSQEQSTQKAVAEAEADLRYWEKEIRRARALAEEEVITPEEFDREQAQYETAKARYEKAQADLNAADSKARTENIQLGYTRITSPINGVVTERLMDHGVLVKPGMTMMRLAQISPIRVQAQVAEKDFSLIRPSTPVRIWKGEQGRGPSIRGNVTAVFPAKDPLTHTGIVEAAIPNRDGALLPGDYVTVTLELGEKSHVLTVPNAALIDKDQQQAVWRVENGEAHLAYVTTGASNAERTEIVAGLTAGDQVVTAGHASLINGAAVVEAAYGPEGLQAIPERAGAGKRLTAQNQYRLQQSLEHMALTARLIDPPPGVGHHNLVVELTPMHGRLSRNIQLEARSFMPAMPKMSVPKPSIRKEAENRFRVSTHFSMPGLWQVDLAIREGGQTLVETHIEVEVTE